MSFKDRLLAHDPAILTTEWEHFAREDQLSPDTDWRIWLLLGGRGAGKTRTGAEWIAGQVRRGARNIALVAPTLSDAREVMLDGESGLLHIGYPAERPHYIASRKRLEWSSGAVGHIFTAEDPDGLRGPQFDAAWADEFCAWTYPSATLSNLRLALRLGQSPRLVITTTPRPLPALKALMKTDGIVVSQAKTQDNRRHLAPDFIANMEASYGGTHLGRQELGGEIITDHPGALWTYAMIAEQRRASAPSLSRVIVAVDPPTTSGPRSDACGLIVAGCVGDSAYILEDATVQGVAPSVWAAEAVTLYHKYKADTILAETNQGGEMVTTILRQIDPNVPVKTVHARRGKITRAEPVASLYDQGRVFHVGRFDALEAEMVLMGAKGLKHSPDRTDALVWAVYDLLLRHAPNPRVRQL